MYKSTNKILEETLSGLHYKNEFKNITSMNNINICIRFNYKRLSPDTTSTRIFDIYQNDKTLSINKIASSFLVLPARYPVTWFGFGLSHQEFSFSNWILGEPPDNYMIWRVNRWHHFCLSFSKYRSSITIVKVKSSQSMQ